MRTRPPARYLMPPAKSPSNAPHRRPYRSPLSRLGGYGAGVRLPNMTPLVDVALVILIFLMLAGNFASEEHFFKAGAVQPDGEGRPRRRAADAGPRIDVHAGGRAKRGLRRVGRGRAGRLPRKGSGRRPLRPPASSPPAGRRRRTCGSSSTPAPACCRARWSPPTTPPSGRSSSGSASPRDGEGALSLRSLLRVIRLREIVPRVTDPPAWSPPVTTAVTTTRTTRARHLPKPYNGQQRSVRRDAHFSGLGRGSQRHVKRNASIETHQR